MSDQSTNGAKSEEELTTELGRVERHLYKLRQRREEILEELGTGPERI